MLKWLHHLIDPHCPDCEDERREANRCNSCEILQLELTRLQIERDKLLDKLLAEPVAEIQEVKEELNPILPKMIPWNVRRQALEAEDRETAKLKKKVTEELEKSIGINTEKEEEKDAS